MGTWHRIDSLVALRRALKRRLPKLARLVIALLTPFHVLGYWLKYKPDRYVLERVIFPALLADPSLRRIVSIGCAWYTRRYEAVFRGREFWTMDIDERMKRHGASRHVIGPMSCLPEHFAAGSVDVIVCHGVLGFGMNSREDCEESFRAAFSCLRPGGLLIVGWCAAEKRTIPPQNLASIRSFQPHVLPPFTSTSYQTFSSELHTFDVYRRPDGDQEQPPPGSAPSV